MYVIVCYVRVRTEGPYQTLEEAQRELNQLQDLHPWNKYEIGDVEEDTGQE